MKILEHLNRADSGKITLNKQVEDNNYIEFKVKDDNLHLTFNELFTKIEKIEDEKKIEDESNKNLQIEIIK